ncbi:uncharacterized protein PV07_03828 [Cladophialophora immunda]|uniref:Uncharacterized protein n=1 Tax=Cladophialophora immunda TaxID=569365 RepID=A0A0D2CM04_9EURO|nr:uncharacterized protein PV07_03828 [Cladophialophora immunda]KIW32268.1 hypothetical protein PV07_03828 [Cladophialophora immunda]
MPVPSFLILGEGDLLEPDRIPSLLGQLCTNPDQPLGDFAIEDPTVFYEEPPSVISLANSKAVAEGIADSKARARLGRVFDGLLQEGVKKGITISAQSIRTFKLLQQEEVLAKMWADDETRRRIKRVMGWWNPRKLYMIVGFKSCINADIGYLEQHTLKGRLSVSIREALELLAAAGVPVPPWLDALIDIGVDTSTYLVQTGQLFGEVVFAVRYREVSRRGFIMRNVFRDHFPNITGGPVTKYSDGTVVYAGDNVSQSVDDQVDLDKWRGLVKEDIPTDEEDDVCIVPYEEDPALSVEDGIEVAFS